MLGQKKQVFIGGTIYTQDICRPKAEAMVIENGKIIYVGAEDEALSLGDSKETKLYNAKGKTILPGLIDGHAHHLTTTIRQCCGDVAASQTHNRIMPLEKLSSTLLRQRFSALCQGLLNANGYTGYFDAGFISKDEDQVLEVISKGNSLRIFYGMVYVFATDTHNFLENMQRIREAYTTDSFHPNTLVLLKDGSLLDYEALMQRPYTSRPLTNGLEIMSNDSMMPMAKAAARAGFNLHIKATGDKAISDTLDLYEDLGHRGVTKTIAQAQIMPGDGVERFAEQSDVFCQTSPASCARDITFTEKALGKGRYRRQLPLNSLTKKRTQLTFGSDIKAHDEAKDINPFEQMHCAVNRIRGTRETYFPPYVEAITIETALKAFTINAAKKLGVANEIGSITPGKSADFTIIDRDLLHIPMDQIREVKVLKTYFKGECVYDGAEEIKGT